MGPGPCRSGPLRSTSELDEVTGRCLWLRFVDIEIFDDQVKEPVVEGISRRRRPRHQALALAMSRVAPRPKVAIVVVARAAEDRVRGEGAEGAQLHSRFAEACEPWLSEGPRAG